MPWMHYCISLRLESPLHIGYRKVGNLMQTRRYVPARTLWGALVAALTRKFCSPPLHRHHFETFEKWVNENLRLGYLWPTTRSCSQSDSPTRILLWPWENPQLFDYLYLDAYASTSLAPLGQSAEEGTLHQVEYIMPVTREAQVGKDKVDAGTPVYLVGDLWVRTPLNPISGGSCTLSPSDFINWLQNATLQLGGERTYGWGRVRVYQKEKLSQNSEASGELFISRQWKGIVKNAHNDLVVTVIPNDAFTPQHPLRALAHIKIPNSTVPSGIQGKIEPLTGYRFRNEAFSLLEPPITYAPGARITQPRQFMIQEQGLWVPLPENAP